MVPNVIERVWVQGTTTKVESLRGTAFTEEDGAHTFRIAGVDASGETVPLSGTVLAKILRADNITIDVSGTITDGVASVTMVGDCYHVPGRFSIVVYLSDGVTTIAIYAAVGDIYRATSDTELDSGTTVPSLVQLEAAYQNALSATTAANTAATGAERVNVSMSKSGDTITFSATDRTGATTTATMSDQSEEVASLKSALNNGIDVFVSRTSANSRWPRFTLNLKKSTKYFIRLLSVIGQTGYDRVFITQGSTSYDNLIGGLEYSFTTSSGDDPVYLSVRYDSAPSTLPVVVYELYEDGGRSHFFDEISGIESNLSQNTNLLYAESKLKNNIIDRGQLGSGVLDSYILVPDETYPNTAWRINGATTTGDTFIYYKYTQNAAITSGNVLLITGRSFAAVWPAYAFYDSNNKLLQSEQSESVSKGRSIQNAIVTVPDSAAYLIVNGESSNPPVVYNISESDLYKILSSSVKPYGKEIVNSSGFSSVLELQNNYIYLINSNAVSTISGLPAGLTGTSVLVKIRASVSHNTDTDYAIFYIMSRANSWFGVCYNGEITWTSLSQYTDFLSGLLTGLVYVEPIDSTYKAGAMHRNGDINTDDAVFIRYEFDVSALQGKEVFISGYHYALGYPLFVVMSNETVIDYLQGADVPNSSKKYEYYRYKIPENATKIVVNANNSAGQSRRYGSLQHVDSDGDLCASLRKESKRYLFIGDSYAEGYNPDGNVTGWCTNCVNYLGLTEDEYVILYKGGARFSAYNQTNTFLNLIKTIAYPFDYFTDIVICGGFNDSMQTEENILSGISAFVAYCKVLFPFARVHIGEVGYNKQPSGSVYPDWEQRRSNIENIVIPTYQRCVEFGAAYLNNVEYWVNEDSLSNSDGIHPTESGNKIIGRAVANAVLSGGAPLPYSADLRLH